ncbi:hypothetical protein J7L18_05545 [Candidatus Bathyarchaeota archaeon]|nr:hypothetical protein [Candidatus Bathyarchaeota archaeon]
MSSNLLEQNLKASIQNLCMRRFSEEMLAASAQPVSVGINGTKGRIDVTVILKSSTHKLSYRRETLSDRIVSILAADHRTFEMDVESDWLGGLLTESLLFPYEPLINEALLRHYEIKLKMRMISEIIDNLILEYPELSREILIKPEYFMWETIARKISLYPPSICRLLDPKRGVISREIQELIMPGFLKALKRLERDHVISISNGYVKISERYIESFKGWRIRIPSLLRNVRDAILRHGIEFFPKMMSSLLEDYTAFTSQSITEGRLPSEIEDAKSFLFIPTSLGLASLSEKRRISSFIDSLFAGKSSTVRIERLGGVLNSVYLITVMENRELKRRVAKVFKSWYNLKWLPIALWTLGSKEFAVLGKTRLEREYSINRLLSSNGIAVPRILHISPSEGILIQEYIEGESLTRIIKRICSSGGDDERLYSIISMVGEEIAKIHNLNVSLGDCKPENIKLAEDGRIFFLDLEQAERGGDQAWDIAEFLYYSGHYASLSPLKVPRRITESFIDGYLKGGERVENIKRVRSPRYIRAFSFFTPPHIIYVIANTCIRKIRTESG